MRCSAVREWLPLAVSQDLPPDLYAEVDEHLDECEPCSAVQESMRSALTALEDAREPVSDAVFDGFFEGVAERVGLPAAPAPEARPRPVRVASRRWLGLLAAAAAVMLLVSGQTASTPAIPYAFTPEHAPLGGPVDNLTRVGSQPGRRDLDHEALRRLFENVYELPDVDRVMELFRTPPPAGDEEEAPREEEELETRSF